MSAVPIGLALYRRNWHKESRWIIQTRMALGLTRRTARELGTIRAKARESFINRTLCERCGREGSSDVCHIKPIRDFPLDAAITDINAPTNLIVLCKNCHAEMDGR